ncbi:MAG: hypothetical protein ACRYFR_18325 [Janthinobacterium lividum]
MRFEPFGNWVYLSVDYPGVYANGKSYELLVSRAANGHVLVTSARHATFTIEYASEQDFLQDWKNDGTDGR